MGTSISLSYANEADVDCYMAKFETDFIYTYPLQPFLWVRFLDNCFCIWPHEEEELSKFHNSCSPNIKFTMKKSMNEIPFLDVLVNYKGNNITTDLYCKPTDAHNYLILQGLKSI